MTTSKKLQNQIETARAELKIIHHQQSGERTEATKLILEGERRMKGLDAISNPILRHLEGLEKTHHERHARTLDTWIVKSNERWDRCDRYLVGREQTCWTRIAWLRVGLWLPQPRWFLDIRGWHYIQGTTSGQFDLGAPNNSDPEDGLKRRAEADELLIQAGFLLVEREEA